MYSDALKPRVYYSQNREDLILESFFPDVEKGFYVDVGASDPVLFSVTKLFYDKGWRGINIEPIKHHYASLRSRRPRDINLNLGVGRQKAVIEFHEYEGDGLSTFSSNTVEEYAGVDDPLYREAKRYAVEVVPLRTILAAHAPKTIHFLKVDVEGFEYDVLAGNDWDKYRPEVICIEANHVAEDWHPLLKKNRYELAFFDGLNEYYTDSTTLRRSKFNFVDNVVLRKDGGIRHSDYSIITELEQKLTEAQGAAEDVNRRLQEALLASTNQEALYQDLAMENHRNSLRAAVAEKALRRPEAFAKYQLKRGHRLLLRRLSQPKSLPSYTAEEQARRSRALDMFSHSSNDQQRLQAIKEVADIEIRKLGRVHTVTDDQSKALRLYVRFVNSVKRLRMRRAR